MRYKAYRYRLHPNKEQQELINKHIGCCRYIYNYGLEMKIKAYQERMKNTIKQKRTAYRETLVRVIYGKD